MGFYWLLESSAKLCYTVHFLLCLDQLPQLPGRTPLLVWSEKTRICSANGYVGYVFHLTIWWTLNISMAKWLIGGFFFCKMVIHCIHQVQTGKVAQNVMPVILLIHLFIWLFNWFEETLVLTDFTCSLFTVPPLQFLRNHFSPSLLMHQVRSRQCSYIVTMKF